MDIKCNQHYAIYELNSAMKLEKIVFNNYDSNWFKTEQQAIDCLIKHEKTDDNYFILKETYLTKQTTWIFY